MKRPTCRAAVLTAFALTSVAAPASAQDYPAKPIRAIAVLSAGGTSDVFMRATRAEFQLKPSTQVVIAGLNGQSMGEA